MSTLYGGLIKAEIGKSCLKQVMMVKTFGNKINLSNTTGSISGNAEIAASGKVTENMSDDIKFGLTIPQGWRGSDLPLEEENNSISPI
jgi:hypothetical protein